MLILAGERYRQVLAEAIGLGTTESQALSYLEVHGRAVSPSWPATSG